jgi:hypothetical protein
VPTTSPLPPCRPQSRRRAALASNGYKRSTPLREQPFSSSAPSLPLRRHANIIEPPQTATPVPLRTSRHRPELRTDAGSSLDPLAGALSCSSAPPLSLPAAWFAPPWNPCSDEPSPLLDRQSSPPPYRLALRPLHRRPPTAGRLDFAGKSPVLTGEKTSPGAASGLKTEVGQASPIRMGRATIEAARMNSDFCYFSFELIQFIPNQIQISEFHRNLFICQ